MGRTTKRFYLKSKPTDQLTLDHFEMREDEVASPQAGEVLVKTLYISLDAAQRAWLQGRTYRGEVGAGTPMPGLLIGEIVESNDPSMKTGDIIEGDLGWQEYGIARARHLNKRKRVEPLTHLVSLQGIAGHTAYVGMTHLGAPRAGDTVLVSAAAGAVGSIAIQLARLAGAKTVGLAGSDEKCDWLKKTAKADVAINYKSGNLLKNLTEAAPQGIDLYFDNVGGNVLEAALFAMNERGRVICCGAVSQYDGPGTNAGPRGIPGLIVVKRLSMRGFVVMDDAWIYPEADRRMAAWAKAGEIAVAEDIIDGFENTPEALIGLLAGKNTGKRIIKLA